jgi:hypothetical protein
MLWARRRSGDSIDGQGAAGSAQVGHALGHHGALLNRECRCRDCGPASGSTNGRWRNFHSAASLLVDQYDDRHDGAIEDQAENGDPEMWVTLVGGEVASQRRQDPKQDGKQ